MQAKNKEVKDNSQTTYWCYCYPHCCQMPLGQLNVFNQYIICSCRSPLIVSQPSAKNHSSCQNEEEKEPKQKEKILAVHPTFMNPRTSIKNRFK